jgi:RNA polymerase sigma-70 factor (ECF subfamily)
MRNGKENLLEVKRVAIVRESPPADSGISTEAFDHIVLEHQRRIHRILLALVRDADAADILTQECFLRAFEQRAGFRGEASVGTWLVRIALNLARDHARSRRVAFWRHLLGNGRPDDATTVAPWVPDPGPPPDRMAIARERLAAVEVVVDRLPHRQRACFLLRFVEGMALEEIAQTMHLKVGTVKTHLARGLGAVRRHLAEWEGSCEDI